MFSDNDYLPCNTLGEDDDDGTSERSEDELDMRASSDDSDVDYVPSDEEPESSSEESNSEGEVDLESLSKDPHPCLAAGHFSIFNSADVKTVRHAEEMQYVMDMDGVVVLSKYLSTFRVCQFGEARAYSNRLFTNLKGRLGRSQLFEALPNECSAYEQWLPGFALMDGPVSTVFVVFRPNSDVTVSDLCSVQERESGLLKEWWMSVLIPALHSLPKHAKTHVFNAPTTYQSTGILPTYVRIYSDDIDLLDSALQDATTEESSFRHLSWYFVCSKYGQRLQVAEGEILGPEAFRLDRMFDLSKITKVSIHIAMNFQCSDARYSLFWHRERTYAWSSPGVRMRKEQYPLFGLSELGNVKVSCPRNPAIEAATNGHFVTYIQHYTPMVKTMEDRMPLITRPHLLTFLLGADYVKSRPKFKKVWEEVDTQRTMHELLEVMHTTVPFDARMELVITENDVSFLSSFRHKRLARAVLNDGLIIKVPTRHFAGYAQNIVKELYTPMKAAIQGTLQGPGVLGTVLLCESLILFLCTGSYRFQAYRVMKAYDIVPHTALAKTRKVDLRSFATLTDNGLLYISRPALERVWIPLNSIPASARATASAMLSFLEKLKAGHKTEEATTRAATIIVTQFKHDLVEMGMIANAKHFKVIVDDVFVKDALPAVDYVKRVFVPDSLPSQMSTKAFLTMAMDLLDKPTLQKKMASKLLAEAKVVPHTVVHARSIVFSPSLSTLLTEGQLSGRLMLAEDAQRLVMATIPLIKANFNLNYEGITAVTRQRPRLTRCVRNAIERVRTRTRGNTRNILAVVCFAAMVLANKEKIFGKEKVRYKRLYRTTNLSRYIRLTEMQEIVTRTWDGDFDSQECRVYLNVAIPRHQLRRRQH